MKSDNVSGRQAYFEDLYGKDPDPWRYQSCDYEIQKQADTLSFLREHYSSGCEVGCSIGVLTQALAPRCDRLIGVDISKTAAQIARERLAGTANVEIKILHLPHQDIDERFDLLVLSEMLYFLSEDEIDQMAAFAARRVIAEGDIIIVSYDGETQTRLNGRRASERFVDAAKASFDLLRSEQREEYHVRLLRRRHDGA